ncbi:hypothetical protein BDN72DRAFT_801433 [Pluteus cervinus]|uniref:Uncharacterized protein n=1 Tax=Pluteus cervinus TaxID=181527 RepID=A0ACD3AGX5_9AGAR|nr:hypothetical protein BDN72DRAFT_801433 [Pluteus cervinus]
MSISWVCRKWRDVSLDWPRLWSHIDFDHPEGIEQFLTRSNDIRFSLSFWVLLDDAVGDIFNHTERFRSFSHGPHTPATPGGTIAATDYLDLDKYWLTPSPNLKKLSLTQARLPQALSIDSPPLREISLTNCLIDLNIGIFSDHLTTLSIVRPADAFNVFPFLDVLEETPALKYLSLVNGFQAERLPFPAHLDVELPLLETITLQDCSMGPIEELLNHLILPGDTRGRFRFDFDDSSDNGSTILVPFRAARTEPPPLVWMHVERYGTFFSIDAAEESSSCEQETHLVTHASRNPSPLDFPLDLDLTSLTTFHLTHFDNYNDNYDKTTIKPSHWRRLDLPNLQRIHMEGDAAFYFLEYLAGEGKVGQFGYKELLPPSWPTSHSDSEFIARLEWDLHPVPFRNEKEKPIELVFKCLRELTLEFSPREDEDFPYGRIDNHHIITDLMVRKALGFGLTRLEYHGWPISKETLKKLQGVVEEVEKGD